MALLPQPFFERDALNVAGDLLGKVLKRGAVAMRITEVEAYCYPYDSANHCRAGKTARNAPMWGPAGHAYVYLCYGIHNLLNIVTNAEGEGAAVLIRSCEPISGIGTIKKRRGLIKGPAMLTGPGKVGAALALDTKWNHHPLFEIGGLTLVDGDPPRKLLMGPRVGIDYAKPEDIAAPWRLAIADNPWVSHRKTLKQYMPQR